MNKQSKPKSSMLTTGLIMLIVVIVTTLIIFITFNAPKGKKIFTARSINDATYDCEDEIIDRFGDKLINKQYDELSSRYNADKHLYAIFYRISINEKKSNQSYNEINDYMVKCLVWEKLGYVSEFTVFDF
jgi:hypothetical protein